MQIGLAGFCNAGVGLSLCSRNNPVSSFIEAAFPYIQRKISGAAPKSRLENGKKVHRCVFLTKTICISQVSKCDFRSIWAYCQNRHAISLYFKIYNS